VVIEPTYFHGHNLHKIDLQGALEDVLLQKREVLDRPNGGIFLRQKRGRKGGEKNKSKKRVGIGE